MADENLKEKLEGALVQLEALADTVEEIKARLGMNPVQALDPKSKLHPSRAGLADYEERKGQLLRVKPDAKDYAAAQAELREAGIIK